MSKFSCHDCNIKSNHESDRFLSCFHYQPGYVCKNCAESCEMCQKAFCRHDLPLCKFCLASICKACAISCQGHRTNRCSITVCNRCEQTMLMVCKTCGLRCCYYCVIRHPQQHRRAKVVYGALALQLNGTILQSLSIALRTLNNQNRDYI
jgi:hypothetical protein